MRKVKSTRISDFLFISENRALPDIDLNPCNESQWFLCCIRSSGDDFSFWTLKMTFFQKKWFQPDSCDPAKDYFKSGLIISPALASRPLGPRHWKLCFAHCSLYFTPSIQSVPKPPFPTTKPQNTFPQRVGARLCVLAPLTNKLGGPARSMPIRAGCLN